MNKRNGILLGAGGAMIGLALFTLLGGGGTTPIGAATELLPYPSGAADAPFCVRYGGTALSCIYVDGGGSGQFASIWNDAGLSGNVITPNYCNGGSSCYIVPRATDFGVGNCEPFPDGGGVCLETQYGFGLGKAGIIELVDVSDINFGNVQTELWYDWQLNSIIAAAQFSSSATISTTGSIQGTDPGLVSAVSSGTATVVMSDRVMSGTASHTNTGGVAALINGGPSQIQIGSIGLSNYGVISQNVTFDGTNFNLQDTGFDGWFIGLDSRTPGVNDAFKVFKFAAGSNPATGRLADYFDVDNTGLTSAKGGLAVTGAMTATTSISSSVATGNNGLGVTVNGARIDFGAGASDYASSDGTTVTFAGPVATGALTVTGAETVSTTLGVTGATTATGGIVIGSSGVAISKTVTCSITNPGSVTALTCADTQCTATGAATGAQCVMSTPTGGPGATCSSTCYVSAADTVKVHNCCFTTVSPTAGTYTARVFNP